MTDTLLRVEHLSAAYGDVRVVWDAHLDVRAGEIVCLVGSNGAGKTTLLRRISGLLPATGGRILLRDRDLTAAPPAAAAQKGTRPEARGIRERVERTGMRRARSAPRHRSVRSLRPRWRHVWVYRAHDPHGYRTYEYVPRRLGGYFTRGRPDCACRRAVARHGRGW